MHSHDLKRDRVLFVHRFLFRLALSAGNIFAWVVIFRVFYMTKNLEFALAGTAALYALSQAVTFILTPLAGMALRRGIRRALILGTLASGFAFSFLALMFFDGGVSRTQAFGMIAMFVVAHGIYRALYWIPYKTAEAAGIAQSPLAIAREACVALMPALAGYALASVAHGAFLLFAGSAALMFISAFTLGRMREGYEAYDWTYGETLYELFARKNNTAVGLFILDGIQGAALLLVWPLAAFLIIGQSYQSLGAILTATLCVTFLARYVMRGILRALKLSRSPATLASIVFSSWMLRLAAGSPVQILAVDVYYGAYPPPRRFSIDTYAHEQPADSGHFVDEYTAIKEMGLCIGRMALTGLFIVLALKTDESVAFAASILTAALAGVWSVFIAHKLQKEL